MNTYCIVRPEHLNHHGYLFGGAMLKWVDEFAWLTTALDFRGCTLVTMAMDEIVFRKRILVGSILRFDVKPSRKGKTSITYGVDVYADAPGADDEEHVFSTTITFVRLNEFGKKTELPDLGTLRSETV